MEENEKKKTTTTTTEKRTELKEFYRRLCCRTSYNIIQCEVATVGKCTKRASEHTNSFARFARSLARYAMSFRLLDVCMYVRQCTRYAGMFSFGN